MSKDTDRPHWDEDWLRSQYQKHQSIRAMADETEITYETLRKWLNRYDIL